jgi:glutamate-1-semialdehyde 2,1-aminomutase
MSSYSTEKSKKLYERALKSIPGGASSASRTPLEGYKPYPLFIQRAEGSKLYDVDGNVYIDYLQALGPMLVGNSNPRIINIVSEQIKEGSTYALPFELQLEVAEKLIQDVPSFEKVSFMNSGSEVVQMAIRLARAYTQKNIIAKFEGAYHGWIDSVAHSVHPSLGLDRKGSVQEKMPIGSGIPENAYRDIMVLPWNDVEALEETLDKHKDEIAGLLVDPCMCNSGVIPPDEGFLQKARDLTAKNGIVLIFDEVITGFRLDLHSAQGKFGITPDLTTLAKAVGGGFPVAAYGGKNEIMDLIAEGKVFRAGTVNANRVAMAAAYSTLEFLEEGDGKVYREIYRVGERLMHGMKNIIDREGVRAILQGYGPMFQIHFTPLSRIRNYPDFCESDQETFMIFRNKLLPRGIFIRPSHFGELYISAAHTDEDIDTTLNAMEDVIKEMKSEGSLS